MLTKAKCHWHRNYLPAEDATPKLTPLKELHCQSLIRVLSCVFELERDDLAIKVSTIASVIGLNHKVHLSMVFQILSFLKNKHIYLKCLILVIMKLIKLSFQLRIFLKHLMVYSERMPPPTLLHLEALVLL